MARRRPAAARTPRPPRPRPRPPAAAGAPVRTTRRGGPRPGVDAGATRTAVFAAAADAFSRHGFDGVVRRRHRPRRRRQQGDDLLPLRRQARRSTARSCATCCARSAPQVAAIADRDEAPAAKIDALHRDASSRSPTAAPWFPPLMMREMAEGAPHLDPATLDAHAHGLRRRSAASSAEGQQRGAFRPVHPVLAYMTILGPLHAQRRPRARRRAARPRPAADVRRRCRTRELIAPHAAHGAANARRRTDRHATRRSCSCSRRPGAACTSGAARRTRSASRATSRRPTCGSRRRSADASCCCAVKEGDRVEAGALIVRLDSARHRAGASQRAKADRARPRRSCGCCSRGSRREDIRQAEAQAQAARDDVAAARAELAAAEADLERFEALLQRQRRLAQAARRCRDAARRGARARAGGREPRARAPSSRRPRLRAGARPRGDRRGAGARRRRRRADRDRSRRRSPTPRCIAPVAGIVTEKLAEAGEVVAPRTPVVVITDLDHAWANVYVPEPAVPRLALGQAATLFTDAGGAGIAGTVTYISPKAEFTPRNVQTADERSKLVYRVKVTVDNTRRRAQAGHAGRSGRCPWRRRHDRRDHAERHPDRSASIASASATARTVARRRPVVRRSSAARCSA